MSRRVLIIAGPPCAGKSTLARTLAAPGDLIVDRDLIAIRLGLGHARQRTKAANRAAEAVYQQQILHIAASETVTAYVVRALPYITARRRMARLLDADVRILDPGIAECLRRARVDHRPAITTQWIHQWYRQYQPDPHTPARAYPHVRIHTDLNQL